MSAPNIIEQLQNNLAAAKASHAEAVKNVTLLAGLVSKYDAALKAVTGVITVADLEINLTGSAPAKKAAAPSGDRVKLPNVKTDNDFWLSLINEKKQGTAEILAAATAKILQEAKLEALSEEQIELLKQRQTAYLKSLFADGKIKSEGERKNRKYFR